MSEQVNVEILAALRQILVELRELRRQVSSTPIQSPFSVSASSPATEEDRAYIQESLIGTKLDK